MKIHCDACQSIFKLDHKLIKSKGSLVRCSKCQAIFKVYPSDMVDRRKFPRTKTRNLIAHVSVDQNEKKISQGLGNALDISKGGMLLETPYPIEAGLISLMAVDKENTLFEIKANLVYCKKTVTGMYQAGIKFIGKESEVLNFVKRLVKEYNYRKNSMHGPVTINFQTPQGPLIADGPNQVKFTLSD
jgi:predicted Zn finger-like uncharacterized protein